MHRTPQYRNKPPPVTDSLSQLASLTGVDEKLEKGRIHRVGGMLLFRSQEERAEWLWQVAEYIQAERLQLNSCQCSSIEQMERVLMSGTAAAFSS